MIGLAVIPTIGRSRYLGPLLARLREENFNIVLVDNDPDLHRQDDWNDRYGSTRYRWRPAWRGIYRQWNLGLRYGALLDVPTLILNDDIVLDAGAATRLAEHLEASEWAILGFDYFRPTWRNLQAPHAEPAFGTFRECGVGGFAFGVNPRRCARVDERFRWWGGDDDLVQATLAKGEKVGILRGAYVQHPQPSLTANANGDLLPEGWQENDRDLLIAKWGRAW